MSNVVKVTKLEFTGTNDDAGLHFRFQCPDCKEEVHIAEYPWWKPKCSCEDRDWSLVIYAEAY